MGTRDKNAKDEKKKSSKVNLKCDLCQKVLSSTAHFAKHMKTIHKPKEFICDYEGKTFNTKDKLRLHIFQHRKYYKISCNVCNKEYKTNQSMRKHLMTHFQQHQCSICGVIFKYKRLLDNHIAALHEDSQEFQCKCKFFKKNPI
jgi:KRAB domain-containing zinc finger protein